MAVLGAVGDLDAAAAESAAVQQLLAQDFAQGGDGFAPRRLGIGQLLAFQIPGEGAAFADVEVVTGHDIGIAALFLIANTQPGAPFRSASPRIG